MPSKKEQFGSGVFASRTALLNVPKTAQDTLFFSATSQDWSEKERQPRHENMKNVYTIGGYNCKYLPHPGKKVPLLTRASLWNNQEHNLKTAEDLELNKASAKFTLVKAGGRKNPNVDMGAKGSQYIEDFGRSVSDERRREAKPALVPPVQGSMFGGKTMVATSHTQTTYGSHGQLARSMPWKPRNNIEVVEPAPDFWKSRQQVTHSKTSIGVTAPAVLWQHGKKDRLKRGEHAAVEKFLDDYRQTVSKSQSAPHMLLPITQLGSGHG